MSEFSDRFRLLKDESGVTLKELSEKLDITVPNLSYYMKGREPSYDILIKISNYFNVTTDWLIGRTDTKTLASRSLSEEIINKVSSSIPNSTSKDEMPTLSIFKDDYLNIQDTIVNFLYYYYCFLSQCEYLESHIKQLDYSAINSTIVMSTNEMVEYLMDLFDSAQKILSSPIPNSFFEYYFDSLTRLDLFTNRYKTLIANVVKLITSNFDGNKDKLEVIVDFIQNAENYSENLLSEVEFNNFFKQFEWYFI